MSRESSYYKHLYKEQAQAVKDAIEEIRIKQWYIGVPSAKIVIDIIQKHTGIGEV